MKTITTYFILALTAGLMVAGCVEKKQRIINSHPLAKRWLAEKKGHLFIDKRIYEQE